MRCLAALAVLCSGFPLSAQKPRDTRNVKLWALSPVTRPPVPSGAAKSANPIDAFIAAEYKTRGLRPVGPADKPTLLRRAYLDIMGRPATPAHQEGLLK